MTHTEEQPAPLLLSLENPVRRYAWGSIDFIPRLLGESPGAEPAAELWMGAHPAAPSGIGNQGRTLADVIASDPLAMLGSPVVAHFGDRLPFLMKVLAAANPLSIQAHPTIEQARAGFAAENARGVPLGAPERNYVDANHKPELLCALTAIDALVGFRPVRLTAELVRELISYGAQELRGYPERLLADGGLRDVVTAVLTLPADQQRDLIDSVLAACSGAAAAGGEWAAECGWAARIAELFPGDSGIVLALLMNLVRLRPSEAVFLSAGRVHAYLRGAGVELMAASDNVLRSGLTVKHVDVAELLSVLDFTEEVVEPLEPVPDGPLLRYPVPVPDFSLATAELDGTAELTLTAPGPQILLVTRGEITLRVFDGREESVSQGHAVFVAAGTAISARGTGQLFQGTTGGLGEI